MSYSRALPFSALPAFLPASACVYMHRYLLLPRLLTGVFRQFLSFLLAISLMIVEHWPDYQGLRLVNQMILFGVFGIADLFKDFALPDTG